MFFLLTYLLPMIGMGLCYVQMGHHLWRGDKSTITILVPQAALTKSRKDKKRVSWLVILFHKFLNEILFQIVKMFAFVVLIFMVCWAPYHIYFIYSYHNPSIARKAYIGHIFLFFYWLAMSNTCVNPIIYYIMNSRFRAYFNKVLCCVPNYLKRSASRRWSRASPSSIKLSFISKSASCPEELGVSVASDIKMPPRALRMKHSHTLENMTRTVNTATNTMPRIGRDGRRLNQQIPALPSLEPSFTYRSTEVLL